MPSSRHRPRTPAPEIKKSGPGAELLRLLGRAVLSYSLKRLSQQQKQQKREKKSSRSRRSSRSRNRDPSSSSSHPDPSSSSHQPRATSRRRGDSNGDGDGHSDDLLTRGDSDMHNLVSQLAVSAVAFGVRHWVKRRREAAKEKRERERERERKRAKAEADATWSMGKDGGAANNATADAELSAALDTVAAELRGAEKSIRRLAAGGARAAPSSSSSSAHRDCPVRDALVVEADRLRGALDKTQASVHNMRNLHPRLEGLPRERGVDRERGAAGVVVVDDEGRRKRWERRERGGGKWERERDGDWVRERDGDGRRRWSGRRRNRERDRDVVVVNGPRANEDQAGDERRRRRRRAEGDLAREWVVNREIRGKGMVEYAKGGRDQSRREADRDRGRERPKKPVERPSPG